MSELICIAIGTGIGWSGRGMIESALRVVILKVLTSKIGKQRVREMLCDAIEGYRP